MVKIHIAITLNQIVKRNGSMQNAEYKLKNAK